jgi:hypothetical protein
MARLRDTAVTFVFRKLQRFTTGKMCERALTFVAFVAALVGCVVVGFL